MFRVPWPPKKINFPELMTINEKLLRLYSSTRILSGANPKTIYKADDGEMYVVKWEKSRAFLDILSSSATQQLEIHAHDQLALLKQLYFRALVASVIAPRLARAIFEDKLHVPENTLIFMSTQGNFVELPAMMAMDEESKLQQVVPMVLSKMLSDEEQFTEFLSQKSPVRVLHPKIPSDWAGKQFSREELHLNKAEAQVLGKIYFILLWFSHLDGFNNIDLTNSGTVIDAETVKPCIVDWGNCLGIGFGGVSLDATAFRNPEFPFFKKFLKIQGLDDTQARRVAQDAADPITGFEGTIPFIEHVYASLPRQVCADLFDMTKHVDGVLDPISKAIFEGFKEMYQIASAKKRTLDTCVSQSIKETIPEKLQKELDHELFGDNGEGLATILRGRLSSIQKMISQIESGMSMKQIQQEQFREILQSQSTPKELLKIKVI